MFLEMSISENDQMFWIVPWTFDITGLGSSNGCRTLNIVGTSLEWKESNIQSSQQEYMLYLHCSNLQVQEKVPEKRTHLFNN